MKRRSSALLAGLAAFTLVAASAATLGGLTVGGLGAESADVEACTDQGITANFTTGAYDVDNDLFPVDSVTLTETHEDEAAAGTCSGTTVTVALLDGPPGGAETVVLGELTGDFDTFKHDGVGPEDLVSAEDVEGIAVSIVG